MSLPTLCIIVAASENNVIGKDGDLPWRIPGDLKYVKARTWGKPIIMGRKTYESLGRPLPGRANIVVTSRDLKDEGIYVKTDLDSALREAETIAAGNHIDEIFIFGGGQLYREALPKVGRIYLTRVHMDVPDGDTTFPELDMSEWEEVERTDHNDSAPPHSYLVLERINA